MNVLKKLVVDYSLNRIMFDISVDDGSYKIRITACDRTDPNENIGIEENINADMFRKEDLSNHFYRHIAVIERRLAKRKEEKPNIA